MAKKAPDPYPALQPVREALTRLYDAVVAPFPLLPELPACPKSTQAARRLIDQCTAWVHGVCEAYGSKDQNESKPRHRGLLGCWDVLENTQKRQSAHAGFIQRIRETPQGLPREIVRNEAPPTAEALLGRVPDDLIYPNEYGGDVSWLEKLPFDERYIGFSPDLGAPMHADPSAEMPARITPEWWTAVCNSWLPLHADTHRLAFRFIRWVQAALDELDSARLPRIRLVLSGKRGAEKVEAVVELAGFPKHRKLTDAIGQFVRALKENGRARELAKNKSMLKKQLPELWPFVVGANQSGNDRGSLYVLEPAEIADRITIERAAR